MEDILAHFPSQVSQAMADYATEVAFKWSRYIFTRREGKRQYGYCTHCQKEYRTEGLKHLEVRDCPECGSTCIVRASGKGRSRLIDEVYFVWYEKSVINPEAIVAGGIYAVRDYRDNYYTVETQFTPITMYLFEPGNSRMLKRYAYHSYEKGLCVCGNWEKAKSVHSKFNHDHIANIKTFYSRESIEAAVKDTPFRYSTWELYDLEDMTKFFGTYAKYPCIEYLTKLGMRGLVVDKLEGRCTYSAINWRGKDLLKVLRLTKQELNQIKQQKIYVTFFFLKVLQLSKKRDWNLSLSEALEVANFDESYYFAELLKLLVHGPIKKIIGYLNKQYAKDRKHYYSKNTVLTTWRDYIEDCKKLEMDLTSESVLFPKSVYNAHQNTIKQVKIKANEHLNEKIGLRAKALRKYRFEYCGLVIRPATSSNELIEEGSALDHCVGTYAEKYAKGENIILLIRKTTEPNKSFFTVEVIKDRVVQVRGKKNCVPDKAVAEFMEAFTDCKLNREKAKSKIPA
jgi:predicted RNA-binding Zn-ribbon protein involved in translation (DUF1610 family)